MATGLGSISAEGAQLGYWPSPYLFDGAIHLEARSADSIITIGSRTVLNNGVVIISEGPGIWIGEGVLIGPGVHIYDSDFHPIDQLERSEPPRRAAVHVGSRCFIGARATICRGVSIGEGSVVGVGSVVTKDIPPWSVAAGVPARVMRSLR